MEIWYAVPAPQKNPLSMHKVVHQQVLWYKDIVSYVVSTDITGLSY